MEENHPQMAWWFQGAILDKLKAYYPLGNQAQQLAHTFSQVLH
jgi:hypothetical protein